MSRICAIIRARRPNLKVGKISSKWISSIIYRSDEEQTIGATLETLRGAFEDSWLTILGRISISSIIVGLWYDDGKRNKNKILERFDLDPRMVGIRKERGREDMTKGEVECL